MCILIIGLVLLFSPLFLFIGTNGLVLLSTVVCFLLELILLIVFAKLGTFSGRSLSVVIKRIVYLSAAVLIVVGSVIWTTDYKDQKEDNYRKGLADGKEVEVPYELLNHGDIFNLWNEQELGNDVNVLMAGGDFYSRKGLEIRPSGGKKIVVKRHGKKIREMTGKMSSINVMGQEIYYRDAKRDISCFNLSSGKKRTICKGNYGEVFVDAGRIYCVDFEDESKVVSFDLNGKDRQVVVDTPVSQFAVCGDVVLYLDTGRRLYLQNAEMEILSRRLASNVDKFFLNDRIYMKIGSSIISVSPMGGKLKTEYTGTQKIRMIGCSEGALFIQEGNKLRCLENGKSADMTMARDGEVFTAATLTEKDRMMAVAKRTTEKSVSKRVVEMKRIPTAKENNG